MKEWNSGTQAEERAVEAWQISKSNYIEVPIRTSYL